MRVQVSKKCFDQPGTGEIKHVLGAIDITLNQGEFVAVFGPSGCGKTTLLNIVAGLDRRFEGEIDRAGRSVIGYLFQTPRLLPWKTVGENLRLVVRTAPNADDRIATVLDMVGLPECSDIYPNRLSVGMARRVSLARALIVEPDLLLLDEPFVSIDAEAAARLREVLARVTGERPTTVIMVTHDLEEAVFLADRILFLSASPAKIIDDVSIDTPQAHRTDSVVSHLKARLLERRSVAAIAPIR